MSPVPTATIVRAICAHELTGEVSWSRVIWRAWRGPSHGGQNRSASESWDGMEVGANGLAWNQTGAEAIVGTSLALSAGAHAALLRFAE